jgi:predicted nucleotidyltransferase
MKEIISAPLSSAREVYVPRTCLQRLITSKKRDKLQSAALDLTGMLSTRSHVGMKDFGIHGSIALNMHTAKSDIDLVVYGSKNFRRLEKAIDELEKVGTVSLVSKNRIDVARRYKGKYQGRLFMYNAVRKPEEINSQYGTLKYSPITQIKFHCKVKDDTEAMFRPAVYRIEAYTPIGTASKLSKYTIPKFVVSMIGCYRNVARAGDKIRVSGMLERVENVETGKNHHQVVVGTGSSEEEHIWPQ